QEANDLATADVLANGQNYVNNYSTAICKPTTNVTLNSSNNTGIEFTATYTNVASANIHYSYKIPISGGAVIPLSGAPSQLPSGVYNITIGQTTNNNKYYSHPGRGSDNLYQ